MTTHYLKIALRNMRRFRLQTIVCLTGLAVGMTCFALGTLWLRYIESFEDFVPDKENIYFVTGGERQDGHGYNYYTQSDAGKDLMDSVAAVTDYCTIVHFFLETTDAVRQSVISEDSETIIQRDRQQEGQNEKTLSLGGGCYMTVCANRVDTTFFRFFGIQPLRGSVKRMEGCIVLTESAARRLFADREPLGQEVVVVDEAVATSISKEGNEAVVECERLTVSAIIPDCPENTQFWYEALMPFPVNAQSTERYGACCTFVKLNPKAKLDDIVGTPLRLMLYKRPYEQYPNFVVTATHNFLLAPLKDLRTQFTSSNVAIRTKFVEWFMLLGALVILCSVINYLITMTSHLRRRAWEFSLRRVLGSTKGGIIGMVSLETFLIFVLAAVLSSLLTALVLPAFREYSGITIALSTIELRLVLYLLLVIAVGMALSALTAWLVMWTTQRNILSSRSLSPRSGGLRGAWGTILQMTLSMAIVFSLVVMLRQVNHLMYSPEIGFTHKNLGVVQDCSEELRTRIHHSALADSILDNYWPVFPHQLGVGFIVRDRRDNLEDYEIECDRVYLDRAYADFFGLQLVCGDWPQEGRYKGEMKTEQEVNYISFDEKGDFVYHYSDVTRYPYDVCVSEAMCRALKVTPERAIGLSLYDGDEYRIGGVVKDIYAMGPLAQPRPVVYRHTEGHKYGPTVLFRTAPGRTQELCDSIEAWSQQCDPQNGSVRASVYNLSAEYEKYVVSEMMLIKILLAVGLASLFVCVIGTFSLVSLALQQRRKEIAIRKVHGATMKDILQLFLKGQVISLAIAAIIAYPIAYIIMKHWLEGYAKQVGIDWWLIPLTFLAISAVVLTTITLKIWRAARESTISALVI